MMITVFLISIVAALTTFLISSKLKADPIRVSAGLTLLALAIFFAIGLFYEIKIDVLGAVFFGASFVGMSSNEKYTIVQVLFSSILFGLVFIFLTPLLSGLGGALGFSAFLSALLIRGIFLMHSAEKYRLIPLFRQKDTESID